MCYVKTLDENYIALKIEKFPNLLLNTAQKLKRGVHAFSFESQIFLSFLIKNLAVPNIFAITHCQIIVMHLWQCWNYYINILEQTLFNMVCLRIPGRHCLNAIFSMSPWDIEILGCCPVGPVLLHGEQVPL